LPNVLDQDSIRVDGVGGKAIISDVVYHPPPSDVSDRRNASTLTIRDLNKNKAALRQQLQICGKQAAILQTYAESLKGADTTGTTMNEFLDIYAERLASINIKSAELSEQVQDIEKLIEKEMELLHADAKSRKRAIRITVMVYAERDGPAEISLTYCMSSRIMTHFWTYLVVKWFLMPHGYHCMISVPPWVHSRPPSPCNIALQSPIIQEKTGTM